MKKEKGAGDRSFFRARKFPAQNAETLFSGKRSLSERFSMSAAHFPALSVRTIFIRKRSFSGGKGACYNTEGKTHSGKEGYL